MSDLPAMSLRDAVYELMAQLPDDTVTTYGDLAAFAGHPYGGPEELPWHRLVNCKGGLAVGFPGGQAVQRQLLEHDGIQCDDSYRVVDFAQRRWRPLAASHNNLKGSSHAHKK